MRGTGGGSPAKKEEGEAHDIICATMGESAAFAGVPGGRSTGIKGVPPKYQAGEEGDIGEVNPVGLKYKTI